MQGKVIMAIIDADVVVFTCLWKKASGCQFERSVAERLEKPIIELGNGVAILTNVYTEEE